MSLDIDAVRALLASIKERNLDEDAKTAIAAAEDLAAEVALLTGSEDSRVVVLEAESMRLNVELDRVRRQFDEYKTRTDEVIDVLRGELIDAKPVLDAAQAWRAQFRPASYTSPPAERLIAAVDEWLADTTTPAGTAPSAAEGLPVSSVEEASD